MTGRFCSTLDRVRVPVSNKKTWPGEGQVLIRLWSGAEVPVEDASGCKVAKGLSARVANAGQWGLHIGQYSSAKSSSGSGPCARIGIGVEIIGRRLGGR